MVQSQPPAPPGGDEEFENGPSLEMPDFSFDEEEAKTGGKGRVAKLKVNISQIFTVFQIFLGFSRIF